MKIRHATQQDLSAIMEILDIARDFMKKNGNPHQWMAGYPRESTVCQDIANQNCYVFLENDKIVGTFTFIIGEDATYQVIEQGKWHAEELYGTIHRLAGNGQVKGLARACFTFCKQKIGYLRMDTHADNQPMQAAILKNGFQKCGIIHAANGGERIAFDWLP